MDHGLKQLEKLKINFQNHDKRRPRPPFFIVINK